ncbi:MAG: glutamate synthase subunit beta [Oscillospiraceae bacterium]|jgi:glutamate synthase (NADPH/NADH) small chain|nr:glutamate synthase subunit beta [Oscillospiraceae bacterium]
MGKASGFIEYQRLEAAHRPVNERIRDYDEFILPPEEEDLRVQAARCMDCGVSFCHAGLIVDGASIGCPLTNIIPEINDMVYRGDIKGAYERLSKTHPFPEFTGRVCPALCEGSCTLGEHEKPVAIKNIERYIIDAMFGMDGIKPRIPKNRTGKRVAVIGSGPSGLSCADMLNQLGNKVTVFERSDRPGGLLMYGIPNMKLDKEVLMRRVSLLEEEGVKFILNTEIGIDYPVMVLMNEYDAIVLCIGSTEQRTIQVPGKDLNGVHTSIEFLSKNTKSLLDSGLRDGKYISAKDKDVIIIGGGDTGTDCAATSIRHGARSVAQLEIMPSLPETRAESNPWPLWPRVSKTDYGQEEAIELFGRDPREYLTTVKEILDDGKGNVAGVKTVRVEWFNQNGRFIYKEVENSEEIRPAGLVLTAMGFLGPEKTLIEQLQLETDARGNIKANDDYASSLMTVFAAGDARRGPSLVVWALSEGRKAAVKCSEYLNGKY